MSCPIAAYMSLDKCRSLRASHNLACHGCTDLPTRTIQLDLPADVYEAILTDAEAHEEGVEVAIIGLLRLAATGEYVLMRREV